MLAPDLLAILRCPKCRGTLEEKPGPAAAEGALVCPACRLSYAVQDGIPNLLVDEARPLQ